MTNKGYESYEKEVIFNNIRSMVQEEVNKVIGQLLESKNYNVNDAQTWTNQICDEVIVLFMVDPQSHHLQEQEFQVHYQLYHHAESRLWTQFEWVMLLGQ